MIKPYFRVFINQLSIKLAFRWNVLTGIAAQAVGLITTAFVWRVVYSQTHTVGTYTFRDMLAYLVFTTLITAIFSPSHMFRLSPLVRKGTLSSYLLRPYSFHWDTVARFLGDKLVDAIVIGIFLLPAMLIGWLPLINITGWGLLLVLTNFVLLFLFGMAAGTLSFWIIQMWPLRPLFNSLMALSGGLLFPIDVLPQQFQELIEYTPFALFGFVNTKALQGMLSVQDIQRYMAASLGWCVFFSLVLLVLWPLGLRKFEGVNA